MKDFLKYKIKDYKYWSIILHQNQGYLGRCVIWCNREEALDLSDATKEEQEELFIIIKELKRVLEKAFSPDWLNYAFLGNVARHLHGHLIPRYSSERKFAGLVFKDERWGQNYRTNHEFIVDEDVIQKIKEEIIKLLN